MNYSFDLFCFSFAWQQHSVFEQLSENASKSPAAIRHTKNKIRTSQTTQVDKDIITYTSIAVVYRGTPRMISGARYLTRTETEYLQGREKKRRHHHKVDATHHKVTTFCVMCSTGSENDRARPKSASLTCPRPLYNRFDIFRSRWIIQWEWR